MGAIEGCILFICRPHWTGHSRLDSRDLQRLLIGTVAANLPEQLHLSNQSQRHTSIVLLVVEWGKERMQSPSTVQEGQRGCIRTVIGSSCSGKDSIRLYWYTDPLRVQCQ